MEFADATLCHIALEPQYQAAQGGFVIIETNGADGACRVTSLAGLGAGCILAQQTTAGFLIDVHTLIHGFICFILFQSTQNADFFQKVSQAYRFWLRRYVYFHK